MLSVEIVVGTVGFVAVVGGVRWLVALWGGGRGKGIWGGKWVCRSGFLAGGGIW